MQLLLFLTLRKRLTLSILMSCCLNYIFMVYHVLLINVFPPIWKIILGNVRLVNGSLPECCTLKCGISQGTILGPLLFLLYINDLRMPNSPFCFEQRMHVDDYPLIYSNGNIHSVHSVLLLNINHWLIANK